MRAVTAFIIAAIYCLVLLVRPGKLWPAPVAKIMASSSSAVYGFTRSILGTIGVDHPSTELNQGMYLIVVSGLIPLAAALLLLRTTPASLGCRAPNRTGWRLLILGYLLATPFLYFMAKGSGMQTYYLPTMKRAGVAAFLSYYTINMLTEHLLFHGVMLAAFRSSGRWPTTIPGKPTQPATGCCTGIKNWLGIGVNYREPGENVAAAWLGLPTGCGFAIIASAVLFALVHVGKDWREAALSFPGGLALAYIAYRGNSWATPFLLHAMTAGTTLGLMLIL